MLPRLELCWRFEPENCFEDSFLIDLGGCKISVQPGTIVATIEHSSLEAKQIIRAEIETYVANLVRGVQLQSHVACTISKPSVTNIDADGRRGYVLECEPGKFVLRGYPADLRYTGADGTVIDTKLERVKQKRLFSQLSAELAPTDKVLSRALRSINASVRDPEDELVHLHEIREAVSQQFGGDARARACLGITAKQWSRFGELCNDLPLEQGRHRGKSVGMLRPATDAELNEARTFISKVMEAYLKHAASKVLAPAV
jgi:hypothetical protein